MKKRLILSKVDAFDLVPAPRVDFRLTLWKPSHFPTRLEIHACGVAWRTFVLAGEPVGVRLEDRGNVWRCTVYGVPGTWNADAQSRLEARLRKAYGFAEEVDGLARLCNEDEGLRAVAGPFAGMRGSCPENLFELTVLAILLQNTTMRRSRDMLDAILRLAGRPVRFDGMDLFCFCTPKALLKMGVARLRQEARVGYRDQVLSSVAAFFVDHPVECPGDGYDRAGLMETLCRIKGVGPYTAGIVASSVFRDPRAYGLDVWKRKIIGTALALDKSMSDLDLRNLLTSRYAPYEGLVVDMLVESACLPSPVCPVYPTREEARQASKVWPRPDR